MLDRKNFRIGNIIRGSQYFDTDEAKEELAEDYSIENEYDLLKIESIEHENSDLSFYLRCLRNDSSPNPEIWNRLEPVKIDRGMLDSIGWYFEEDSYISPCENFAFGINGEVWFRYDEENDWIELRFNINYFHELQNAFYLITAKEIDISGISKVAPSACD